MGPKEAASVMGELDVELATAILLGMRERQAAKVLGLLEPKRAASLTARMARPRRATTP
jgi:flagellar motility protein MotE (MotC chaperone)